MADAASGRENNSGESTGYQLTPRMALSLIGPGLILLAGAFLFDYLTTLFSIPKMSTNERMKRALRVDVLALRSDVEEDQQSDGVRALRLSE